MRKLFPFALCALAATSLAATTKDSGTWVDQFQCSGSPRPFITVPATCDITNPAGCTLTYSGPQGTFHMHQIEFKEQTAAQDNLELKNGHAVPPNATGECTTADGHYCYRLQPSILSHSDPFTDGVLHEEIAANYEWSEDTVRWGAYGGIDVGDSTDLIQWSTPYSYEGRTIIDITYECDVSGVQEILQRSFQVDWTNWTQPPQGVQP